MELGEVHNIKGHPKRCSMQILSGTVAGTSCSNDRNSKRNYEEFVLLNNKKLIRAIQQSGAIVTGS